MRGNDTQQSAMFSYLSPDERVPPDHPLRPIREVEFASGVGAMTAGGAFGGVRVCAAIVGHADMTLGDEVGRLLDRCLEVAPERFRIALPSTVDP